MMIFMFSTEYVDGKEFCMTRFLEIKLAGWIVCLLIFISTNVWSVNLETELIGAAGKGNFPLVKKILDTYKIEQEELNAAFLVAVKKGNAAIVERFLQAGVDVNLRADNSYTPLMQAARDGREQAVEVLLAAGADVNAVSDENDTALILAAEKDRRKVIALLLAAKVNVNAKRNDGMTALLLAAQEGHQQTIQVLIKANAEVNYQLENGKLSCYSVSDCYS